MENPAVRSVPAAARLPGPRLGRRIPPSPPRPATRAGPCWNRGLSTKTPSSTSTRLAVCLASDGEPIRVSLRLAEPPTPSYLQVHAVSNLQAEPTLVSADGSLLLIHVVHRDPPFASLERNYFVYKAHPNPATAAGWLRLLPDFEDHGASVRQTGVAARRGDGEDDFVVAGFRNKTLTPNERAVLDGEDDQFKEVGELSRFTSSTNQWDLIELPIPYDPDKGLYKFVWCQEDLWCQDHRLVAEHGRFGVGQGRCSRGR